MIKLVFNYKRHTQCSAGSTAQKCDGTQDSGKHLTRIKMVENHRFLVILIFISSLFIFTHAGIVVPPVVTKPHPRFLVDAELRAGWKAFKDLAANGTAPYNTYWSHIGNFELFRTLMILASVGLLSSPQRHQY